MVIQLRKDYESVPRFLTCPLKGYESRVALRSIVDWFGLGFTRTQQL